MFQCQSNPTQAQQAPYSCLKKIVLVKQPITKDDNIEVNCDYDVSYSIDGVCWTMWSKDLPSIYGDYYIRFRVTSECIVYINGCVADVSICLEPTDFLLQDCNEISFYDHLDCAIMLQQQLSDNIICMLGIPVYYFRVEPKDGSSDFTFKEFKLHNVVACKHIKIMVEDGQLPSSNHKLSQFDFDWENDWVVEVSKTHFARAFGDDKFPKQRDFVWVPMMQRMWEVNSAYDERNESLMYRSSTWRIALTKYKESTNVSGFEDEISQLIDTYDEVFGIEGEEQRRESGIHHKAPAYNVDYNVLKQDHLRSRVDADIINDQLCHRGLIVARNLYKNIKGISYQNDFCSDEGTISFIIEPKQSQTHLIMDIGGIEVAWSDGIVIGDVHTPINSTSMVIYRWSKHLGVYEIEILKHKTPDKPKYLIRKEQYFFERDSIIQQPYIKMSGGQCNIHTTPHTLSNIKVYKKWVDVEELFKYNTNDKSCVINDVVRPLNEGRGFSIK